MHLFIRGNKTRFLFFAVILSVFITSESGVQAVVIKAACLTPEGHPATTEMRRAFTEISRLSNGEVIFKLYPGSVAGDEIDVIRQMRINRIDMSTFTGVGVGLVAPQSRVVESPCLFRNYDEVDFVRSHIYDEFTEEFQKSGYILMGWSDSGFVYIFSKHNFLEARNFKNFRTWVWKGDPEQAAYFDNLGFSTVPLDLADVVTGLETNMIDTCFGPLAAATAFQWYSRVNYMFDYPIANAMLVLLMTEKKFMELSPGTQKLLKDEIREQFTQANILVRKLNSDSGDMMRNSGISVLKPSLEQTAFFDQQARITIDDAIARGLFSREKHDRIRHLLEQYRAGHADSGKKPL